MEIKEGNESTNKEQNNIIQFKNQLTQRNEEISELQQLLSVSNNNIVKARNATFEAKDKLEAKEKQLKEVQCLALERLEAVRIAIEKA